jgi:hypothetical protein
MHDAEVLIAAIHRDWGEAQDNHDEFRFFTGLRPSEQIALVLADLESSTASSVSTRRASPASIDARRRPEKTGAWNCARERYRC